MKKVYKSFREAVTEIKDGSTKWLADLDLLESQKT